MMRRILLIAAVLIFAVSGHSFAATHSAVGTWKLNLAKSDNGGMPNPKSLTLHVTKDSSSAIAWRVREVDDTGAVKHLSYRGAPDGQMKAVKGGDGEQWSDMRTGDDTFVVKESMPDGSFITLNYQLSTDGETMTGTGTRKMKDGSSHPMKWVWEKVR